MTDDIQDQEEPENNSVSSQVTTLALAFNEGSGQLDVILSIESSSNKPPNSVAALESFIESQDYGHLFYDPATLEKTLGLINRKEVGRFPIGRRRDAQLEILIDADKKSAYITISKPYGGSKLTKEALLNRLKLKGIPQRCLLEDKIDKALSLTSVENLKIAESCPPEKGEDAQFLHLVESDIKHNPEADEDDIVDFYDLFEFIVVEIGTPVMQRTAPTQGSPGYNVLGETVAALPGSDTPFNKAIEGCEPSSSDPNVLVATIKGHPVEITSGMRVDTTLELEGVHLATGNIEFDGSLEIKGDIAAGMEVNATGDIHIKGMVERGATVQCGADIFVGGGIIGNDQSQDEYTPTVQLNAKGSISAKFANQAHMTAEGDIQIKEYLLHCHVESKSKVLLGQPGGKGQLIGGHCHGKKGIVANIIGSDAYVPSIASTGANKEGRKQLGELRKEKKVYIEQLTKFQEVAQQLVPAAKKNPDNQQLKQKLLQLKKANKSVKEKLQPLKERIQDLETQTEKVPKARVQVKRKIFPNVTLNMDSATKVFDQPAGPSTLALDGNNIINK